MLNIPHTRFSAFLTTALAAVFCTSPAAARDIQVHPDQSIQAAVDQAAPGDRILVFPATYHEKGHPSRLSHKKFTCLSNASNLLGQSAKSSSAS